MALTSSKDEMGSEGYGISKAGDSERPSSDAPMKTSQQPATSRRSRDAQRRRLERVVGPQIAGVVRLRRLNLDKAWALRSKGNDEAAKVWEVGAASYAHEVCELLEALRPNDKGQA